MDAQREDNMAIMVSLSDWSRKDMTWWRMVLPMFSGKCRLTDPDRRPTGEAIQIYSDAAAGSMDHIGRGLGFWCVRRG